VGPRGYNHDVRYRGRVFHVQSEVTQGRRPQICTQLFFAGAVLATARRPLCADASTDEVESLMRAQHKSLLRELCRGSYDAWLAAPSDAPSRDVEVQIGMRAPLPSQLRTLRRRETPLEIQVRDEVDANEVVTVVSCAGDVIAIRRTSYEPGDPAARVQSIMDAELEAMAAKVRRGGIDARLPAFVFVPPPLPQR